MVMAYRLETVIAEKIHAALTRGINNTRMRDYYDFYTIDHRIGFDGDAEELRKAVLHTFTERETTRYLEDFEEIIETVRNSTVMNQNWESYQVTHLYASDIPFSDTCDSALALIRLAIPPADGAP